MVAGRSIMFPVFMFIAFVCVWLLLGSVALLAAWEPPIEMLRTSDVSLPSSY